MGLVQVPKMMDSEEKAALGKTFDMVKEIIRHPFELSLYFPALELPLAVKIEQVNEEQAELILSIKGDAEHALNDDVALEVSLDFEPDDSRQGRLERVCLEKVSAHFFRLAEQDWEVHCQLGSARVFINSRRGGVRIPFVQGMRAQVILGLQDEVEITSARIRNLSQGGCLLELPIKDCFSLLTGLRVPRVHLRFPNGDTLETPGIIRHIRPFGRARHLCVGIEFNDMDTLVRSQLVQFVADAEAEVARRLGLHARTSGIVKLFMASNQNALSHWERGLVDEKSEPPMVKGFREIARRLQLMAFYIKNDKPFPEEVLHDSTDSLLHMLQENREQSLYALSHLLAEATWVRHTLRVATWLADLLMHDREYRETLHEAVSAVLLHNLGKVLLMGKEIPSLNVALNDKQKAMIKGHVALITDYLERMSFPLTPLMTEIITCANERKDGSGYPEGLKEENMSPLVQLISVLKMLETLSMPRNERSAMMPIDAYRWLQVRADAFDARSLVRYIRCYGLYPIGSLVRYSGGFLAWVMALDDKGMPSSIRVVKNMAFPNTVLDTVLTRSDISQVGKLDYVLCPVEFNMVGTS